MKKFIIDPDYILNLPYLTKQNKIDILIKYSKKCTSIICVWAFQAALDSLGFFKGDGNNERKN